MQYKKGRRFVFVVVAGAGGGGVLLVVTVRETDSLFKRRVTCMTTNVKQFLYRQMIFSLVTLGMCCGSPLHSRYFLVYFPYSTYMYLPYLIRYTLYVYVTRYLLGFANRTILGQLELELELELELKPLYGLGLVLRPLLWTCTAYHSISWHITAYHGMLLNGQVG